MHRLTVGAISIDSITERTGPWRSPEALFPAFRPDPGARHLAELGPIHYDRASNRAVLAYQSFVVRTPRKIILIDTCVGPDKGYPPPLDYPKTPWAEGLAALGLQVEDIDVVFCTHLHIDHTGWNTALRGGRWVPTFPRATYVFHRGEYAYWEAKTARGEKPPGTVWSTNCAPVLAAGQGLLVDDDYHLDEGITLELTPGHTPGHCCVNIASHGERAAVVGDLMHHALQLREPDWSTIYCPDPAAAAQSRRRYLSRAADEGTVLLAVHIPAPTAGRVAIDGERFRWQFL